MGGRTVRPELLSRLREVDLIRINLQTDKERQGLHRISCGSVSTSLNLSSTVHRLRFTMTAEIINKREAMSQSPRHSPAAGVLNTVNSL